MNATSGYLNLPLRTLEQASADTGRTILFDEHLFAEQNDCARCSQSKWPSITAHCLSCRVQGFGT